MRRAFTLIELLVVVAIIAILAAIAVPNFLEAQTRSKVSRAKNDLRSVATALEAYYVDHNRYPPDAQYQLPGFLERLRHLTTPVAFISSLPDDPFADRGRIIQHSAAMGFGINPYASPTSGNNFVRPLTFDYACRRLPDGGWEDDATWRNISAQPDAVIWGLRSAGPAKWPIWLGHPGRAYDPTNGTTSDGIIIWTGPGRGEDRPFVP